MRILPLSLLLALAPFARLVAQNPDPIILSGAIPDQAANTTVSTLAVDLRNHFAVPSITGQLVQFSTPGVGVFNVEMNASVAPNTVANFLAYVNANRYANSFVHRTDRSVGVIQGGSFLASVNSSQLPISVTQSAPINLETGDTLLNSAGTIAMARQTAPNTATSGWFINVTDNSSSLPPASSGGYARFGRVVGTGMTVVNSLYALPVVGGNVTVTGSSTGSAQVTIDGSAAPSNFGQGWVLLGSSVQNVVGNFVTLAGNANQNISSATLVPYTYFSTASQSPLNELTQLPVFNQLPNANTSLQLSNLIVQDSIAAVPVFPSAPGSAAFASFSVVSSDPSLVTASVFGSSLFVAAARNLNGSATVTVTATDSNGNATAAAPFNVTVTRRVLDFNADGNTDLVFQNNPGQIFRWNMNGTGGILSGAFLYAAGLGDWRIRAIADVNNDGIPDIIFQNTIGQVYCWILTSTGGITTGQFIYGAGLGDWRLAVASDLNRDGIPDLVFQNNAGQIYYWLMNGAGGIATGGFYYTGALGDWRLVVIADVNSDGNPDLIFQNNAGQIFSWNLTTIGNIASSGFISAVGLGDWRLVAVGEMNGDGITDFIFQNTIGQLSIWYMNGNGGVASGGYLYGGALGDWRVH